MTFISHYIQNHSLVTDSTVVLSVVEPNSVFNQLSEQCLIACRKRVSCSSCPTTSWQPSRSRTHPCRALQAKFALGSLKCLFSACCEGLSWSSSSRKNHAHTLRSILAKCLPRTKSCWPEETSQSGHCGQWSSLLALLVARCMLSLRIRSPIYQALITFVSKTWWTSEMWEAKRKQHMCVKKRRFDWLIKRVSITTQYMKPLTLRASALRTALISTLFGKFKPEITLKSAWKTTAQEKTTGRCALSFRPS